MTTAILRVGVLTPSYVNNIGSCSWFVDGKESVRYLYVKSDTCIPVVHVVCWLGVLTFLSTIDLKCLVSNTSDLIAVYSPIYSFDVRADNLIYQFFLMGWQRPSLHVTCHNVGL